MVRIAQLGRTWLSAVTPAGERASRCSVPARCCCFPARRRAPAAAWRYCAMSCRCRSSSCRICWAAPSASALLVLANGLYRRLDAAWYLTMWLLCAGVLLSLLKGFDYEEAIILGAVAVMLVSARGRFRRRASLDRAALLRFVGRGGAAGARRRDLAGVVRVSARALQQAAVVAICVRGAGAAQPARLAAGGHDRRRLRAVAPAASLQAADLAAEPGRSRARGGAHRECPRRHGESGVARRQESAVQRGSDGLHHVPGLRQQLGFHGRSGRSVGAVRAAGVDASSRTATAWRSRRFSTRSRPTTCRCTSIWA